MTKVKFSGQILEEYLNRDLFETSYQSCCKTEEKQGKQEIKRETHDLVICLGIPLLSNSNLEHQMDISLEYGPQFFIGFNTDSPETIIPKQHISIKPGQEKLL